ncbi:MAG: response regulator [Salibacteraceae bacterium]
MRPTEMPSLFIVEDNSFYRNYLSEALAEEPFVIEAFSTGETCMENLYRMPAVVVLDHQLGSMSGIEILKQIKAFDPDIQVIVLSGQEDLEVAVNTLRFGAFDYLTKDDRTIIRLKSNLQKVQHFWAMAQEQQRKMQLMRWALIGTMTALIATTTALLIQL